MSIVYVRSSLLSVAPRVTAASGWLIATTSRLQTFLSCGAYRRQLHVDGNRKRLTLRVRSWWVQRTRELRFDELDHIAYRYDSLATSFYGAGRTWETADRLERYTVELVLRDQSRLDLFAFMGEGAKMTGPMGVLLGDDLVDAEGTQEEESRRFIEELMRLTGLSLTSRADTARLERLGVCPACGHRSPPRAKCLYCGATLPADALRSP